MHNSDRDITPRKANPSREKSPEKSISCLTGGQFARIRVTAAFRALPAQALMGISAFDPLPRDHRLGRRCRVAIAGPAYCDAEPFASSRPLRRLGMV